MRKNRERKRFGEWGYGGTRGAYFRQDGLGDWIRSDMWAPTQWKLGSSLGGFSRQREVQADESWAGNLGGIQERRQESRGCQDRTVRGEQEERAERQWGCRRNGAVGCAGHVGSWDTTHRSFSYQWNQLWLVPDVGSAGAPSRSCSPSSPPRPCSRAPSHPDWDSSLSTQDGRWSRSSRHPPVLW